MVKTLLFIGVSVGSLMLSQSIQADEETPPSLELLEFLADWKVDQGEWLDPLHMQQLAEAEHIEVKAND